MKIRVPATSANLGPGFDSCGIALTLYLELEVGDVQEHWHVEHSLGEDIPSDASNLVIQTALEIVPNLQPHELKMTTDIPAARGLGSSSTAIVAGIELANQLGNLNLSTAAKVTWATRFEGHPDNVAPAICGDLVIASYVEEKVYYVKQNFPKTAIIVFVPDEVLLTSESREVLPKKLKYKEAVQASSVTNVMLAALLQGDLNLAGKMMEKDLWHEKYRAPLVPHLKELKHICKEKGAYACVLSGAGPTILILAPEESVKGISKAASALPYSANILKLEIDRQGIQIFDK